MSRNLVKAVLAACHMLFKRGSLGRDIFMKERKENSVCNKAFGRIRWKDIVGVSLLIRAEYKFRRNLYWSSILFSFVKN